MQNSKLVKLRSLVSVVDFTIIPIKKKESRKSRLSVFFYFFFSFSTICSRIIIIITPITNPLLTIGCSSEGTLVIASAGANDRIVVSIIGTPKISPSLNVSTAFDEWIISNPAATCVAIKNNKTIPIIASGVASNTDTASGKSAKTIIATAAGNIV